MATVREFVTKWGFDVDDRKLKYLDKRFQQTTKSIRQTAEAAVSLGTKLSLGLTLPIGGLGAASIKAASDAEETINKFSVVFRDVSDDAEQSAKEIATGFGLATHEAKELLANTGDLLTGFGFTGEKALELSDQVQRLSADLASFTNFSGGAAGASKALTKALLGERESVKELGVSILEEDVKAKIQALKATGELTNETQREQKAIATLAIAMEQSKNAIGDFERSKESFANQSRILRARVLDLSVSFGSILLPFATKVVDSLSKMASFIGELNPISKHAIVIFLGLAATLGPLVVVLGFATQAILSLRLAMLTMRIATAKAFTLIALKAIALGAAFAFVFMVADDLFSFFTGQDSVFGSLNKWFEEIIFSLSSKFPRATEIAILSLNALLVPIKAVFGIFRGLVAMVGTLSGSGGWKEAFSNFGKEYSSAFEMSEGARNVMSGKPGSVGLDELLGLGGIAPTPGPPSQSVVNQNVNQSVNISTTGMTPEQATEAVRAGTREGIENSLRATRARGLGAVTR